MSLVDCPKDGVLALCRLNFAAGPPTLSGRRLIECERYCVKQARAIANSLPRSPQIGKNLALSGIVNVVDEDGPTLNVASRHHFSFDPAPRAGDFHG